MPTNYGKYKGVISSNRVKRVLRNRFVSISLMTPCENCGYFHPAAMDWHHRDSSTKYKGVSQLVRGGSPVEVVKKEIEKCVCLCSNCHRIHHSPG